MVDYLNRVINEFPEIIMGGAVSPVAEGLFTVKPLEEKRAIA
jgi:hypothetical protein